MKHVIITSINQHYGDFLISHWLRSLYANINLKNIDIVILNYGLSNDQINRLKKEGVIVVSCKKTGHIVNNRFADAANFLKKNGYDQILFVDGGDIIFQSDISFLFTQDTDCFRAVKLDLEVLFYQAFIPFNFKNKSGELYSFLKNKPVLNAGFVLSPKKKFIEICQKINNLITNKNVYGPDQVALNYFLHQEKIKLLNRKYNFMITTTDADFVIKNGIFYFKNGEKIAVVHNAGHNRYLRPIKNFGYGQGFNQLNFFIYHLRRSFFKAIGLLKPFL